MMNDKVTHRSGVAITLVEHIVKGPGEDMPSVHWFVTLPNSKRDASGVEWQREQAIAKAGEAIDADINGS